MNKQLLLLACVLLSAQISFSQKGKGTYNWGIGGKYKPAAVSIKHYSKQGDAIELLLSDYKEGYRATLLAEFSPAINRSRSIRFLLGPGLHVGTRKSEYIIKHESNPVFGFDGIIGLEWKIPKIPIAIQADLQPSIDVIGNSEVFSDWGGVTLKLAF